MNDWATPSVVLQYGNAGHPFRCRFFTNVPVIRHCQIAVVGASGQLSKDLSGQLADSILQICPGISEPSAPCGGKIENPLYCEIRDSKDFIRVLVIVADQNNPIQDNNSDLGKIWRTWQQHANSFILPVLPKGSEICNCLPEELQKLNVSFFDNDFREAVHDVLFVSEIDRYRRIFITYRRDECSSIAEQLFEEFSKKSFEVFLDRFDIPPAVDFQVKLTEKLADKSLVIVLESPKINESEWARYEISFAKQNRIGLFAIKMPKTESLQQVEEIEDAARFPLGSDDIHCVESKQMIKCTSLNSIVDRVRNENRNAYLRQLYELRIQVASAFKKGGIYSRIASNGMLAVDNNGTEYGLWVNPLPPRLVDFYYASTLGENDKPKIYSRGIVAARQEYVSDRRNRIDNWLCQKTDLGLYDRSRMFDLVRKVKRGEKL